MNILCPICKKELIIFQRQAICINRHSFDRAKEGYINLIVSNKKKSTIPGDNENMVVAREHFLQKGYYAPLKDKLLEVVNNLKENSCSILDAGCGTGYYSLHIKNFRNNKDDLIGIDISKFATKKASKKDMNSLFLTASIFDIPIKSNSQDIILDVFAPKSSKEFKRILKDDGYLIVVYPGEKHLWQLKKILYKDNIRENVLDLKDEEFSLIETIPINYNIEIDNNEDLIELISMTPYMYKTKKEDIEKLYDINRIKIDIEFRIVIYKK